MAENAGIGFASTLSNEQLIRSAEEAKGAFRDISRTASEEGTKIDNAFKNLGKAIGGYFSIKAAADFGKQIVKVRGEIESLEVSFKTLLGDEKKAVSLMSDIRKFAASTPMQMNDLAAGAQTLLGFNIEAEKIMPTLQALGDISMGDSQKFQSLTLAFAQMSSTGRLMGQDLLQMINAGFNPLVQIAEKTGKSVATLKDEMSKGKISVEMVTEAFMDATSEGGKFYGMLEKQSQGIQGSLSNVQGALQDMFNDLGEKMQEPVTDGLKLVQRLIQNYETVGKVIGTLVASYGAYKAAVMAYNAAMVVSTNVTKGYTIAQQIEYVWLLLVEKAQALLNKTMLKNPFVLAATAIISLVAALAIFKKRANEAEKAQQALNNAAESSQHRSDELKNKVDEYVGVLEDENASEYAHYNALQQLKALLPDLLKDVKTYNDYLEHRKELLNGMPKAQDEQENKTLEERVKDEERYTALKKEQVQLQLKNSNSYGNYGNSEEGKAAMRKNFDERLAIEKKYQEEFNKAVEDGYKGTIADYITENAKADREVLNNRKAAQKQAEWDAKPIEQKIEIKKEAIAAVESQIEQIKTKPTISKADFFLNPQLDAALNKLGVLQGDLAKLQAEAAETPKTTVSDIVKEIQQAEAKLRSATKKTRGDASETNLKTRDDAQADVDAAKAKYKRATGKDYDQVIKAGQDRVKAQKEADAALKKEQEEFAKWMVKQSQQAVFERRQSEIDAMKGGLPKTLKQIELDYDEQIAAVSEREEEMLERLRDLKEKEWEAANPEKKKKGETFDRSSVTASALTPDQQKQLTEATERAAQERARKEKEALEDTLKDVQTYSQKRLAIIEEYKRKEEEMYEHDEQGNRTTLRSGFTQGNVDENSRQQSEALKGLDAEFASQQATYEAWCNQIAQWTYTQLAAALEEAKAALALAESDFGVDSKEAAVARQRVKDLENEMKKLLASGEATGDKMRDTFNDIKPSLSNLAGEFENLGGTIEELGEELGDELGSDFVSSAGKALKAVGSVAQNAITIFDSILTLTQGTTTAIQTATTGATTAMAAAAEGAAGAIHVVETASVILAVIGAALGIAQQIYSLFKSSAQKKHEEELAKIEDKIDDINDAYDDLDRQSKKTFGASNAEIRRQQVELKKAQIELLKTAVAEEKAQKKPDNDKIKEWQNQIKTLEGEMADLEEAAVDAIYGEDIKSAIESMAEAITDAWANGSSSALSAKEQAKKYLKQIVLEAMKDTIAGSAMVERLREKILAYFNNAMRQSTANTLREIGRIDGALTTLRGGVTFNIDVPTWEDIEAESEELAEYLETIFGQFSHLWDDSDREGSKKGIATASQESVDENNGRLTFIQGAVTVVKEKVVNISDNSDIIRDNTTAILGSVLRIESNTDELSSIRTTLEDMQTQGVRLRT